MKSPEYGPASAAMSTRRPEPKQFEAEYFTYLTPESFTILPPDENTPTPSPPRVPDPNKLTPRKRRKNQAFAIIAEAHSPNNSRSGSPTGGRVSPFRGRGFNPTGSRHASPTSSPPLLLSPTKPPRTSSILRVSQIPKPILIRRSSVEDVLSPESSPTSQQRHNRREDNSRSNLNVKHSRSMSNIAPRHLSAKPPPSPRRVSNLKTSFVRLSPIIGSSPETGSDPIPSSPSRIPRSKSQPPSRLTSPNVSRAPSRNTSRPTSRNASRNASRETSPSRSPSKIPMKSSAYKNIPAKIDTFSRIASISKPKVPLKPKVYSTRSSVGDRSTKPMVRKNVNRSTSSVSRRDADDTETTDTDRETVRGSNVRSLPGRTHSRLEIHREKSTLSKQERTRHDSERSSILRTHTTKTKSVNPEQSTSGHYSKGQDRTRSDGRSNGNEARSNGTESRNNETGSRNNETGSKINDIGSKNSGIEARNNDNGSRNNETGSRNIATGSRTNGSEGRTSGIGMGNRSGGVGNNSKQSSSGYRRGNGAKSTKGQDTTTTSTTEDLSKTDDDETTEDAKDDDILSVTIENIGGISTTQIVSATTETIVKPLNIESNRNKHSDISSQAGGMHQLQSSANNKDNTRRSVTPTRNKNSNFNQNQNLKQNERQHQNINPNERQNQNLNQNERQNQSMNQNERQNQNLNQNQSMNQNERQNQNLNQNERQNQNMNQSERQNQNERQNQSLNQNERQNQNLTQNERQNQSLNQNERQNQNIHNNQNQNLLHNQNLNQNSYQGSNQNNNQNQNANRNNSNNGNGNSHSPANGSVRTNSSDQNRILNSSTITSNSTGGAVNQVTESVNNNVNNHLSNSVSPSLNSVEMNARNNLNNLTPTDSDKVNKSLMDSAQLTNSANLKLKQSRTVIVDEIKPIKITVREKSDGVEVQSGNIGMTRSATNGIAERPLLPPSPNNQSGDQETQASEDAKKGRCAKLFACCNKKAKEPQEPEAEVTIENEKSPKCWDKLQCCKSNKVYDSTKPTGCFSNWKRGKENEGSWAERRDSILSAPPKKQERCASLKRIFCMPCSCCRKPPVVAESVSRRKSTMSKKTSLSSTMQPPPEDTGPKLDTSLVEYTSHMHGAIPVLPVPLAWICLILNVILPGVGTILSGLFCLCIGIPRFSQRDGIKPRIGAFVIDIIVGISQLFTVLFCLVGWGWSIWWGVIMLKIAKKYRKIKKAEAIALKIEEDEKEREKEKEEQAAPAPVQVPSVNINHADRDVERGTT